MSQRLKPLLLVLLFLLLVVSCTKEEEEQVNIAVSKITANSALLSWNNVFSVEDNSLFQVYMVDSLVMANQDVSYYELTGLKEETDYSGSVVYKNINSGESNTAYFSFKTKENSSPGEFILSVSSITGNSISLSWSKPHEPDGDELSYALKLGDEIVVENLTDPVYTLQGLEPVSSYFLTVTAKDDHGNEVKESTTVKTLIVGAELTYKHENFGGGNRDYGLYIPSNSNSEKLPLVIHLHGYGGSVWPGMISNYYVALAEAENFVSLMPLGKSNANGDARWDYSNTVDLNFISRLLDSVVVRHNIDTERIYMSGHSNGAFMTYYLAKELEDRLAAIGPIAGTLGHYEYAAYQLEKPMPLCHIHGTADSTVQVNGNKTHVSFERILEFWIPQNHTSSEPIITEMPNLVPQDLSTVTRFEYKTTNNSSGDIVYYRINNGNHSIPGMTSWSNRDINACDELWKFFKPRKLSDK